MRPELTLFRVPCSGRSRRGLRSLAARSLTIRSIVCVHAKAYENEFESPLRVAGVDQAGLLVRKTSQEGWIIGSRRFMLSRGLLDEGLSPQTHDFAATS